MTGHDTVFAVLVEIQEFDVDKQLAVLVDKLTVVCGVSVGYGDDVEIFLYDFDLARAVFNVAVNGAELEVLCVACRA